MTALAILAFLAAAALLVVAAELLARIGLRRWGGYYRYPPYHRERLEIDEAALPGLSPVAHVEINRDGERGDPPPAPVEDAYRALLVGGSAAECGMLDQHETLAAVVQRALGRPEGLAALGVARVHVGNVARSILPCEGIDLMLRRVLPRYPRLDLVLVMVGASDVLSWMERGLPSPIPDGGLDLSSIFEQHPEGPWAFTPARLALRRLAAMAHRRLRRPLLVRRGCGRWLDRVRRMRAEAPHVIDQTPDATALLDHLGKHLAALLCTARARAPRVILLRQPWLAARTGPEVERLLWSFGVGRPYRERVSTYFSRRVIDELMRLVDARASAVAAELGVEQVDLMARIEPSARTFYDDVHFTPEGAEAVGRIAAEAILHRRVDRRVPHVVSAA